MVLIYATFFTIILFVIGSRDNWEFDLGFIIPYVIILSTMFLFGLVLVIAHEDEVEEDEENIQN